MIVQCGTCKTRFNDADQSIVCPHDPLVDDPDTLQRHLLGAELVGKHVRRKLSPSGASYFVIGANWEGKIMLQGASGWFDPHQFVAASETAESNEKAGDKVE